VTRAGGHFLLVTHGGRPEVLEEAGLFALPWKVRARALSRLMPLPLRP
jgi:hypothetical protein